MQRKVFWMTFLAVNLVLDVVFPLLWATVLSIPAVFACWWVAYRSGWFE
ncbi:MAG: hypothetical protein JO041_15735 [Acidobacteria bacterium]|nr:hypothetical protein [Acidobacteriota bacterium]